MAVFTHGKKAQFTLNAVDISTILTDVNFPQTVATAETSALQSVAKSFVVGLQDATIALQGNFDATTDAQVSALVGQDAPVPFVFGPMGPTTGNPKYSGNAIITSYDKQRGIAAIVKATVNLQVTGAVVRSVY